MTQEQAQPQEDARASELMSRSPNFLVRFDNATCAYCLRALAADLPPTEDHVIGRRFVPKGTLAAQWNLVLNACFPCNQEKGKLENDLSAIVVREDILRRFGRDPILAAEAARKDSARSNLTGKAVRDSDAKLAIGGTLMGMDVSLRFVSGPQIDPRRAFRLAQFHVGGFFYWITLKDGKGSGLPWTYAPVALVPRADWGNPQMLGFQQLVASWHWRVHAIGADGYFKIVMRRSPVSEQGLWAWALEWNKNYRLIGFFGHAPDMDASFRSLPTPIRRLVGKGIDPEKGPYEDYIREEIPIPDDQDRLFSAPEDGSAV